MATVKFTVECEMEERWVPQFTSMLRYMEACGVHGTSKVVGIFSDGDGDFRPKFSLPESEKVACRYAPNISKYGREMVLYDAG